MTIALQHAARRADHHDAGQIGHAVVVIKRLLGEERRAMRQLGQHRTAAAMFEPEAKESILARRTGGELLRLVPIVGNLRRVAKRAHRKFPGYVAVAHQFMNIRTCDLTWIAARMSVSGANADMSSTAAAAELR